jgi:hypothetical protein
VGARLLVAGLVLAAALLDAAGAHGTATPLLVVAVPTAGVAGLHAFDSALRRPRTLDRLQLVLATLVLLSVLVAAAVRSPLAASGDVPGSAVSALVVCLGALALQALVYGAAALVRQPRVTKADSPRTEARGLESA